MSSDNVSEDPQRAALAKAERRAIMFGDVIHNHVIAMQSAIIDADQRGDAVGMA